MAKIQRLNISLMKRNAIARGPISSDHWNDSFDELTSDLSRLASQWNNLLVTLVSLLPDGSVDSAVNAYTAGLDGKTMYADAAATNAASTSRYYNTAKTRPNTLKEQFEAVYSNITSVETSLNASIANTAGALTDAQKAAIGLNIFDSTQSSSSTSLDGRTANNALNITQVGKDLYGSDFVLNNNGTAILTNSVRTMVNALLALHNGSWSGDATLSHDSIPDLANMRTFTGQDDTNDTTPDYSSTNFVTQFSSLEAAIGALDTALNNIRGAAFLTTANSSHLTGEVVISDPTTSITVGNALTVIGTTTIASGTLKNPGLSFPSASGLGLLSSGINTVTVAISGVEGLTVMDPGEGEVCLLVRRKTNGVYAFDRVSLGASDSGGTGFKVLRVPNG